MDKIKILVLSAVLIFSIVGVPLTCLSQGQAIPNPAEFRIDIDIYNDEKKPPVNIKTIFTDGKYIELNDEGHRVTIVDPGIGNITILDTLQRSRVSFEMTALENQLNNVLQKMTEEERRKFSSNREPTLDGDLIVLGNDRMVYKFRPMTPNNPNIAISYGDFANWSVRINALFLEAAPILRMELNQLLIDQRQLPLELRRVKVTPPSNSMPQGKTEEIVARMFLNEKLSQEDKSRVASVLKSMNEYTKTTDKEFFLR